MEVVTKCVIGDDRDRLADAVRAPWAAPAIVILSGGLGPTEDDLTREAVAQALGRELVFHADIAEALEQRFAAMKRKMSEINKRQAFVIARRRGAAQRPRHRARPMGGGQRRRRHAAARSAARTESHVRAAVPAAPHAHRAEAGHPQCIPARHRHAGIGPRRAHFAGLQEVPEHRDHHPGGQWRPAGPSARALRHRSRGRRAAGGGRGPPIESLLGDRLYSRNGDPLEVVVGDLLRERQATVAVAESCTGGMLGARLTTIPGSSQYFVGGFITYSNALKSEMLGVARRRWSASARSARRPRKPWRAGARERTGATYALSITGVAGPDGGTEEKPVGLVYLGIAGPEGTAVTHRRFLGDRERIRVFTTQAALDLLRRRLHGIA